VGHPTTGNCSHLSDLLEFVNANLTNFATNTPRFEFHDSIVDKRASTGYVPILSTSNVGEHDVNCKFSLAVVNSTIAITNCDSAPKLTLDEHSR